MSTNTKILKKYSKAIKDDFAIIKNSNKGISADAFFELIDISGISRTFLAEQIFDISVKSMMRYQKEEKKLNPRQSETALKLLNLFNKGNEIFGSLESFKSWINKPAFGLGNQIPVNLMNTSTGIDLIEEELLRIEFGALA